MTFPFGVGRDCDRWRPTRFREFLTRRRATGRPDLPLLGVNLLIGVNMRMEGDGRPAPSADLSGYQVVRRNDLVMNQLGKPHGSLGVSPFDGIISPAYFVAAIGPTAEPRYVHHLVRSRLYISEYERRGKYMPPSQFDISWEQFRDIEVSLPPLDEQRAIADYLDTETARIDALIAKKRRMIDLLGERRWLAFLARVDAKPATAMPFRRALKFITDGPFGSAFTSSEYVEAGLGVVRLGNIGFAQFREAKMAHLPADRLGEFARYQVREGDLLVAGLGDERNHAGRACVAPDVGAAIVKGKCFCARLDSDLADPDYVAMFLSSPAGAEAVALEARGSTRSMINLEIVKSVSLPMPGVNVQRSIVAQTRREWRAIDELNQGLVVQLDLLHEHRQALITAAVTGELMVPGVAA